MEVAGRIGVVLADDEDIVRHGFRSTLENDARIMVVGEASNHREAVAVARHKRPDVILAAASVFWRDNQRGDRRPLQDFLPKAPAEPRVAVIVSDSTDEELLRSLRAGVRGFLLKRIKADELVRAVHAIAAGGAVISPEVTRRLIENFEIRLPFEPANVPALSPLSHREREVLAFIVEGRSNREIAKALYLSETTVKSHVSRLLHKLGVRDRLQAASLVTHTT